MTTPQNHQMYGDLVGVFINIAAVVLNINILAHLLQENDYSLRATAGPLSVFSCQLALGFFSVWSFWFQKRFASYAAFASNLSLVSLICTHQWPAAVAPLLTPMFVWQLVVLSANTPHSFFAKLCMALAAASVATLTSVLSSIHSVQKNVGPIVAFTAIFVAFEWFMLRKYSSPEGKIDIYQSKQMKAHVLSIKSVTWDSVEGSAGYWVVSAIFIYLMSQEIIAIMHQEGYAEIGSYRLISASLFGVSGLVFVGAFRDKTNNELARMREAYVAEKTATIRLAKMALDASETAIAVVDDKRSIVIFNAAFQNISGNKVGSDLGCIQLEDVLNLSTFDTHVLMSCFEDTTAKRENDFFVDNRFLRVAIFSNSSMDTESADESNYFNVVLRDVSNERILADAVSAAQQQALETLIVIQAIENMDNRFNVEAQRGVEARRPLNIIPDSDSDESLPDDDRYPTDT